MEYRVLIVDDDARLSTEIIELIQGNKVISEPDRIICESCESFVDAFTLLTQKRFDLVILDLKDDASGEKGEFAGFKLYEDVKKARFIPIIFYSGYAEKIKEHERPFVRMITKGDVEELRVEVKKIFDTKLPLLIRHLEEELRVYMWDSIERLWSNEEPADSNDFVYLIARRLSNLLQGDVLREFFQSQGAKVPKDLDIHPIEMYVWPPISIKNFFFGDILQNKKDKKFFVVLSPSCDLQIHEGRAQANAEFVILGECTLLSEREESKKMTAAIKSGENPSNTAQEELRKLINTNKDRLKYLPSTNFLPDLLLDLQKLSNIEFGALIQVDGAYEKIASLDTPFAEALQSQLARYYGRIGTPNLDGNIAYERAIKKLS